MTDCTETLPWETSAPFTELTGDLPEPTPEQWAAAWRDVVLNMHSDHLTIQ